MAITQTFEKRRLVITLGENEAPASAEWEGVTFTRNEDGSDAAPPFVDKRSASSDDIAAHVGQASADQAVAFERFNQQVADLNQQLAAGNGQIAALTMERNALKTAADVVAAANATWDATVTPQLVAVGAVSA